MKTHIKILIILILFIFSCKNNNEKKIKNNVINKRIVKKNKIQITTKSMNDMEEFSKKILSKQLKQGGRAESFTDVNDEYSSLIYPFFCEYKKEDLESAIYFQEKILSNNNIDIKIVQKKMRTIFEDRLFKNSNYLYLNISCSLTNKFYGKELEIRNEDSYILKGKGVFIPAFIPELIDYQKDYPDLGKIEENYNREYFEGNIVKQYIQGREPESFFVGKERKYKYFPWKDQSLEEIRKFNENLLINRYKYLFFDDKSKLPWLINNDINFMHSLVLNIGYLEDKKLLLNTLDFSIEHEQYKYWVGAIAFDTSNFLSTTSHLPFKYQVRENVLNFIIKNDFNELLYCNALIDYITQLLESEHSLDHIIEIIAETLNLIIITENHHKNPINRVAIFYKKRPELIEKLKDKKYFNLPILEYYTKYKYIDVLEFGKLVGEYRESTAKTIELGTDDKIVKELKDEIVSGVYGNVTYVNQDEKPISPLENIVKKEELVNKSKKELKILRNEIFARKGFIFSEEGEMDKYFRNKKWYLPISKNVILNYIEKKNVSLIKLYEKEEK
ncbi:YARHG domain-containing protein [Tenacibaculum finnmarkense]|uniref:YARHG domain-containing protein n=1 Tax=Tenacibaculum finnmarkense TaxID=2781243 RepID=UPI001EFA3C99|nr:YARHG domain-containing protein [Tenacibaculum finnmarkense]MCG8210951.1 YARHG domain-containing protein [Tenacibaculum finnmarkense genomovar finnmarkense]